MSDFERLLKFRESILTASQELFEEISRVDNVELHFAVANLDSVVREHLTKEAKKETLEAEEFALHP